ncbi:hypothetical protein ACGFIE_26220 [Micromonospora sp. NPDC049275]|uniref:hypothetical protein n=1 Tax=Micromonospora sp. NPDC049275 TaxID=3364268 RepID=UPI003718CA68
MNSHMSWRQPGRQVRTVALWSFPEDVLVETGARDGSVLLLTRWGEIRVADPDPTTVESLRRMSFGPVSLENVLRGVADDGVEDLRRRLSELLDDLQHVVIRSVGLDDGLGPWLSVVPLTPRAACRVTPPPADRPVWLSPAVQTRHESGGLTLEIPGGPYRVVLHRPDGGPLVEALAAPSTLAALTTAAGLPAALVDEAVAHLLATGVAVTGTPAERAAATSLDAQSAGRAHE